MRERVQTRENKRTFFPELRERLEHLTSLALKTGAVIALLLILHDELPLPQDCPPLPSAPTPDWVTMNGNILSLHNQEFKAVGPNIFGAGLMIDRREVRYLTHKEIDDLIQTSVEMGSTVIRTHGLISFDTALSFMPSPYKIESSAFDTLDYFIDQAQKHHLYIIAPLMDKYHYYHGGLETLSQWADPQSPEFLELIRFYVTEVLNHRNVYNGIPNVLNPTIAILEGGNELTEEDQEISDMIVQTIREIAPWRIISAGQQANPGMGVTFNEEDLTNCNMNALSAHLYPPDFANVIPLAQIAKRYGKAFYVGEFGNFEDPTTEFFTLPVKETDFFQNILEQSNLDIQGLIFWSLLGPANNEKQDSGFNTHGDGYSQRYPLDPLTITFRSFAYDFRQQARPSFPLPELKKVYDKYVDNTLTLWWSVAVGALDYTVEQEEHDGTCKGSVSAWGG